MRAALCTESLVGENCRGGTDRLPNVDCKVGMRTGDVDSRRDRIHIHQSDGIVALNSKLSFFDIIVAIHLLQE